MKLISVIMLWAVFFCIFLSGEIVASSVSKSLLFCFKNVVPSLFVYVVLSEVFIQANMLKKMSCYINKYLWISKKSSYLISAFIISTFCGAPIGAKLSYCSYKSGIISKKTAILLNSVTNNISISFVFGLCSVKTYMYIEAFIIMIISSILSSVILAITIKESDELMNAYYDNSTFDFSKIIKSSMISMLNICASIAVFQFIADMLVYIFSVNPKYINGFFEFSNGIYSLDNNSFVLMTFYLCFGGFSLHSQIMSVWEGELKYKYIIIPKMIQAVLSIFFCKMFLQFVDKSIVLL